MQTQHHSLTAHTEKKQVHMFVIAYVNVTALFYKN